MRSSSAGWAASLEPPVHQSPMNTQTASPTGTAWRRTLLGVIVAVTAGVFAVSFINPFAPLFLVQDLGVHNAHQLALWTGLILSSSSLTQFIASPLWGMVADRQGRKKMLIRAQVVAGVMIAIMGFVQNPPELLALRLIMGLASGVFIAAMALVVSESPRARVGWAVGMTSSARAVALSASPLAAGLLATILPLRVVFVIGGLLMVCSTLPVILLVRETAPRRPQERKDSIRRTLRVMGKHARTAIMTLLTAQFLIYLAYAGGQQLILLRVIALTPKGSSLAIGVAFGAMGLASGLAAATSYRLVPMMGFRLLAITSGLLIGIMFAAAAIAPTIPMVAISATVAGVGFGGGGPALQSMLGLEAPREVRATLFGAMGSATALGQATGQLSAGLVAAAIGIQPTMCLSITAALAVTMTLWLGGREPAG
jgi:MFS transporter, DHA1 family, multidrug resistance protein